MPTWHSSSSPKSPQAFEEWARLQRQNAATSSDPEADAGKQAFLEKQCAACHTIRGTTANGTTGPDLTHVGGRKYIAAGLLGNYPRFAGGLDRRSADPQARQQYAHGAAQRRRTQIHFGISGGPEMNEDSTKRDLRDHDFDRPALEAALEKTWKTPSGLWGVLTTVDHKIIGRRYIFTAFVFLALGGVLSILMRLQLAQPEARVLGPDRYNQIFTMHGANMMFLFAVPVMEAMAVYLVPLMVGTRNIAFPRLNAFSYWMFLAGGTLLWVAFAIDMGPDVGWFAYVPLSGPQYAAGKRADIWAQMITFTEVSALAVAVEIVVTVFKQRAPGMSLDRVPLFVWSMLVTSFIIILAMPAIMIASTSLILDRLVGTHFFNPAEGGDVLLWQHLFWFFGHPEVYIIFLPAVGMVSTMVATFARRPVFGYLALVMALIATGNTGLRSVGSPHVRHRLAAARRKLFHRLQHGDRCPRRHSDFLLAGDAVGRKAGLQDAAAFRHRLHRLLS